MKLETTAASLKTALVMAGHVVERRTTIAVLSMVKIDGNVMTAIDLDTEISVTVPVIGAEGAICVPHALMLALVKNLPADQRIMLAATEKGAVLNFAGGRYLLPSLPSADFPVFPDTEWMPVDVNGEGLKRAVAFVAPVISSEETRYYLNGVCIDAEDAVATDGHRMATYPLGFDGQPFGRRILPSGLAKLIGRLPAPNAIRLGGSLRIALDFPGMAIRAKTIDGTFPDWKRVVPSLSANAVHVTLATAQLRRSVKRISAVGRARKLLTLAWEGHRLSLFSRDMVEDVVASEIMQTEHPSSGTGTVTFNSEYIAQQLAALKGEAVTVRFDDKGAPSLWTCEGMTGRLILMPARGADESEARSALSSLAAAEGEAA